MNGLTAQDIGYIDKEEKTGGVTNDNELLKDAQQDDSQGMLKYGIDMGFNLGVEKTSYKQGGILDGQN